MLESLRQHHRLRTAVLGLFIALWLVALAAGMPVRMTLPLLGQGAGSGMVGMDGMAYCGAMPTQAELVVWLSDNAGDASGQTTPVNSSNSNSSNAHNPACLLCMALAAPQASSATLYYPPRLGRYAWQGNPAAAAWGQAAAAPLPARGPPLFSLV